MRKIILTVASGLVCLWITGCATWTSDKPKNKNSMWSSMQFWKKEYQTPSQLAAIWTPDTLTMTGKPPTRGFGGRVYFYNADSKSISVEGEFIVHGYEESKLKGKAQPGKREADKTFIFTQEQFSSHYSPSELGASYSVWIPWDGADGMQREICLIPSFKSSSGEVIQGEPAKLVLQGRSADPEAEQLTNHISIQESQAPTVSGDLPNANRGMRTTTISVPGHANRLVGGTVKTKSFETSETSGNSNAKLFGGVAVGGTSKGLASAVKPELTTVVNDLNSTPIAQRSYNLTANTAAYSAATSAATPNVQMQSALPNLIQPTNNQPASMPNMLQPQMPVNGPGSTSPATFQNILPPHALPNQASAPAFPVQQFPAQSKPSQNTYGQVEKKPWQPYGHAALPLINPNTLHYSPDYGNSLGNGNLQVGNSATVTASASGPSSMQVQTANFNSQQVHVAPRAWGQTQTLPPGQPSPNR